MKLAKQKLDTKQIFSESLIELLKHTSFSKITIQKIVDNCGFTRQAFYLHFQDKYDLSIWMYKHNNDTIIENYLNKTSWEDILCKMLTYHKTNQKQIMTLMDFSGQNSLREYIHIYSYDVYSRLLQKRFDRNFFSENSVFAMRMYCCGSSEMVIDWIKKGMRESPQYLAYELIYGMHDDVKQLIR
jgi:probable dihydroxyacetone kinase regulator